MEDGCSVLPRLCSHVRGEHRGRLFPAWEGVAGKPRRAESMQCWAAARCSLWLRWRGLHVQLVEGLGRGAAWAGDGLAWRRGFSLPAHTLGRGFVLVLLLLWVRLPSEPGAALFLGAPIYAHPSAEPCSASVPPFCTSLCLLGAHVSSRCLLRLLVPPCFSAGAESCAALGEGSSRCMLSSSPLGLGPTWPWGGCHGSRRCSSLLGRLLPESWGPWVCCSVAPCLFRCLWEGAPWRKHVNILEWHP